MTLVTCLCLTRNRREWLPKAIACYQAQTYENRELLILADGESVRDLVPKDDPTIWLVEKDSAPTVGAKRNAGVKLAAGEIICHWDDDDYSAPGRIADQVDRLQSSGRAVTGYNTMRFTDGEKWYLYSGGMVGTSLCYRKSWALANPFPDKQTAEDNAFFREAHRGNQLVWAESGLLMHASIHEGNTSKRRLDHSQYKLIEVTA